MRQQQKWMDLRRSEKGVSVEDVPRLIDRDVDIHKEVTVIRN